MNLNYETISTIFGTILKNDSLRMKRCTHCSVLVSRVGFYIVKSSGFTNISLTTKDIAIPGLLNVLIIPEKILKRKF